MSMMAQASHVRKMMCVDFIDQFPDRGNDNVPHEEQHELPAALFLELYHFFAGQLILDTVDNSIEVLLLVNEIKVVCSNSQYRT